MDGVVVGGRWLSTSLACHPQLSTMRGIELQSCESIQSRLRNRPFTAYQAVHQAMH